MLFMCSVSPLRVKVNSFSWITFCKQNETKNKEKYITTVTYLLFLIDLVFAVPVVRTWRVTTDIICLIPWKLTHEKQYFNIVFQVVYNNF